MKSFTIEELCQMAKNRGVRIEMEILPDGSPVRITVEPFVPYTPTCPYGCTEPAKGGDGNG